MFAGHLQAEAVGQRMTGKTCGPGNMKAVFSKQGR